MKEGMQILRINMAEREGQKFSMVATVGYDDKIELVLKSDYEKAINTLKKIKRKVLENGSGQDIRYIIDSFLGA